MVSRNSTLYLGNKWVNIIVGKIIVFFGIMMGISIEPCNMGGYLLYFLWYTMVILGRGDAMQTRVYNYWGKYISTLIKFKQIHSALHPEAKTYFCGYRCHQIRYFICVFNEKWKIIYFIGDHGGFHEKVIVMRICQFPGRV